ncbi:MAG: hypothetical protein LBK94_13115 [Prevotellaceae bacterium]|jgi:hypothetical protein|nr:hypothetical protein [Prevotellaceae bacterium]
MEQINITEHDFVKQNLTTIKRGKRLYDKYKCTSCGLEGIRYDLSNCIHVKRNKKCLAKKTKIKITSKYVLVNFGFDGDKKYDIVPCPKEYEDKYKKSVWVYSNERREPVRLLPDEFVYV